MKNKQAKAGGMMWFIVIAAALVVSILVYAVFFRGPSVITTTSNQQTSGGEIVTTNPTISVSAYDAQKPGTSVANALTYQFNNAGSYVSTPTTAAPGEILNLLITNNTQYHNAVVPNVASKSSGVFPVAVPMNKNATVTESIYYKNTALSTGGGTNNITDLGNGQSYSMDDDMQIDALTSTQDMVCVFELTSGINASTDSPGLTYDGKESEKLSTSGWYTPVGTNSGDIYTFTIPALSKTGVVRRTIYISAKTDGRFIATSYLKKTCYTKENFVDTNDGKAKYDIVDKSNNIKSIARYSFTAYFQ